MLVSKGALGRGGHPHQCACAGSQPRHASTRVAVPHERIQPVERLNGRLLLHTEHGRMLRRVHLQSNDTCRLIFKLRVVAGHVPADVASIALVSRSAARSICLDRPPQPSCGRSQCVLPSCGFWVPFRNTRGVKAGEAVGRLPQTTKNVTTARSRDEKHAPHETFAILPLVGRREHRRRAANFR